MRESPAFYTRDFLSLNIKFGRDIYLIGDIFAILFPLTHALGQQIFDLSVYAAKVVLCPCCDGIIKLGGYSQGYLLFFFVICHSSVQAAAVDNRLGIVVAAEHHKEI